MRVVVASDAALEREQLRQAVLGQGLECSAADAVGLNAAAGRLASAPAQLALVSPGFDPAAGLAAVHGCAAVGTVPVYAVWDEAAPADLPALIRAGARGYVRKAELGRDLLTVIQALQATGEVRVKWGRVIAVTGGLPGVGVTTVATNLAFALAENAPGRVALAQLADGTPDLAHNLNLRPAYPQTELAAGWYRLDASVIKRSLADHPAGVSVLADQQGETGPVAWLPAALRQVLVLLRSRFEFVVADLGHSLDAARIEALRFADSVAVVVRLDVPAVRIGRQHVRRLAELGVPAERVTGVVNRYGQKEQLPWKQARDAFAVPTAGFVPDDPARVNSALNTGQPLVQAARDAEITRSFAGLAGQWSEKPAGRRELANVG